jgi:hypothetical protein
MYSALVEFNAPDLDELRVSVLINRAVVVNLYVQQILRHAVVTLLSSLVIPPQTLVGNLVVNYE